uniref:Uncharacterized protein n=1 Tax=Acrobeloides nanus TaxID=290746 RepID=A0A914EC97_9BILA
MCAASANCYRASIGRIRRERIVKEYKTILMRPDGSTLPARTNSEPKILVQLPVDLTVLSEEDRLHRLSERKKKVKVQKDDELDVTLDLNEYAELWKEK